LYTFALFDVHQWIGSIVEILPVGRETLNKKETQSARWELYQSKLFHIYPLICIIFFTCNFYNIASRFPKDILLMLSMRFHNIPCSLLIKKNFLTPQIKLCNLYISIVYMNILLSRHY
jgi:hypothetical protein